MGVTPKLKDEIFDSLKNQFGVQLPTTPGMDTLACMEAADRGEMQMGFCLGGNLYGSNPDSHFAARALSRLQMSVMLSTTLNTGHAHGLAAETYVLPVLARDEEPEPTTQESMFNFVRLSDGGPRRLPGPRSEIEVIAEIARRVNPRSEVIDWSDMKQTSTIRRWIAAVVPGYEPISEIDQNRQEFQIGGRTFHEPQFATPDQRAVMHVHSLPELQGDAPGQVRLMTVRSEGQFNTVVYEEEDLYRNQDRRDVILLHPQDLARLGLIHDQPVTVTSDTGSMQGILARAYDSIRPGNALMYYPEANVLVARRADPASHTPAFKGVIVRVEAMTKTPVTP
jgi:anaerobic selenocysteine-containing dehydrogenase